jgi:ribosomal protein L37AE/L43A
MTTQLAKEEILRNANIGRNMTFDEIPEDQEETYQCPWCGGVVKLRRTTTQWECESCDFVGGNLTVS